MKTRVQSGQARCFHSWARYLEPLGKAGSRLCGSEGAQLVELALTLPLLVVMLVGVFDFGGAFNVKQKLTNTVREAARFGSSLPTSDLENGGTPNSVLSIRNLVDDYLVAASLNDCSLVRQFGTQSPALVWTFTANGNGCPGTLTLTVDRSCCSGLQATVNGQPIQVISTHVKISYPYRWRFDNVISLLAPGSAYAGVSQIQTEVTVANQD